MPDDELEDELLEDEDELRHREALELAGKEQQELAEQQYRDERRAAQADAARAIQLAHTEEAAATRLRVEVDRRRQVAVEDLRRKNMLRDAAVGRDDPEGRAIQAAADRAGQSANRQENLAGADERLSRRYTADAADHRADARDRVAEPPASEAVRKPPAEMPEATKFRANEQKLKKKKQRSTMDLDLGE